MTPHLTISGRRADITLAAPERRNALGPDDLRELTAMLAEIEAAVDIDVVVLRATGNTFCAGYDLHALREELAAHAPSAAHGEFARVVDALENLSAPTICALDGAAYGGGTDIALACDFRIGTARASLAVPAARFGLQFYYGGLRRYVERVGVDAAKRAFLLAMPIDAAEALRIGFLTELVVETDLDARVEVLTEAILANASAAVRGLKRSLNAISRGTDRPETIDDAFAFSLRAPDTIVRLGDRRKRPT